MTPFGFGLGFGYFCVFKFALVQWLSLGCSLALSSSSSTMARPGPLAGFGKTKSRILTLFSIIELLQKENEEGGEIREKKIKSHPDELERML